MELVKLFKTADFIDKEKTEFPVRTHVILYLIARHIVESV